MQEQNREVRDSIWQLAKDIAELKVDADTAQAQYPAIEKKTQDALKGAEKLLRQYGMNKTQVILTHMYALDALKMEIDYLIEFGKVAPW